MALDTAERDKERRALPEASAAGAISSMRIGDVGNAIWRYRGVALVVAGIFVASGVLPGPDTPARRSSVAATRDVAVSTEVDQAPLGEPVFTDAPTVFDDQPSRFSTIDPSERFESTTDDSEVASPPTTSRTTETTSTPTTTTTPPTPLLIRASAWSTRTASTPLASEGVPDNSLPVGLRLGAEDKLSFVRLSGTADVLRLRIGAAEGQRSHDAAQVRACPITSDWESAEALSFNADPTYDCATSAQGEPQADGSWAFDLSAFPDPANDKGFALVPVVAGTLDDWQVAFAARA